MDEADENAVVEAAGRERVEESALVLAAAGIPHAVQRDGRRWHLVVPAGQRDAAGRALVAFRRDAASAARRAVPDYGRSTSGWIVAVALVAAFVWTGPRGAGGRWFAAGSAEADRIRAGELWRTVTALTLHADAAHVAGNAVMTAILLPAVTRTAGAGTGCLLVLAAGALGNLASAALAPAGHASVGASTALFGAIGILAGLQLVRRAARRWVPLGAGLALLALLGTGEHADLGAHLFGLGAGLVLGVAAAPVVARRPGLAVQRVLLVVAAAIVAAAWARALR